MLEYLSKNSDKLSYIITFTLIVFTTVISPLLTLFNLIGFLTSSETVQYVMELITIFTILLILGVIIATFTVLSYYMNQLSLKRLATFILSQIFFLIYTIVLSGIGLINVTSENLSLFIDFRILYVPQMLVPFFTSLLISYKFAINRNENYLNYLILRVLNDNSNLNSKTQIKKYIQKNLELNPRKRSMLIKNLAETLHSMENIEMTITRVENYIALSEKGFQQLLSLEKVFGKKYAKKPTLNVDELEVWTEEELRDLNKS